MSNAGSPPPGWYPDATQPGLERWWDGNAWGQATRTSNMMPPPGVRLPPGATPISPVQVPAQAAHPKSGLGQAAIFIVLGILGTFVLLIGGCAAVLYTSSSNGDLVTASSFEAQPDVDGSGDQASTDGASADAVGQEVSAADGEQAGERDVVSCVRVDEETITLELVNTSSVTSSYFLTVGFFDDAGQRLADESSFVNAVRPGERSIEDQFVFEEQGTVCAVIAVDRFATESIASELAEISECRIGAEADGFGDFQATVSATNGSAVTSDYTVQVAFIDSEGIRRGSGSAFIGAVRSGETAPGDVLSSNEFVEGSTCEVVAARRDAS